MKRILLAFAVASLAQGALALNQGMPEGSNFYLEQNQQAVREQQAFNQRISETGGVQRDTEMASQTPNVQYENNAAKTLNLVQQRESARRNIAEAHRREVASAVAQKSPPWWRFPVMILVVGALLYIAKRYIELATPNLPEKRRPMV